ncbi:MAG TPA: putative sulfate exporter family transporter [Caulobacteraceae bacterium]|jgi:uncharacterized integral membrane protein (TIGR00698 family)|nr:putative sulfate exporter family transporter [Caulobacteraceae bacterium]
MSLDLKTDTEAAHDIFASFDAMEGLTSPRKAAVRARLDPPGAALVRRVYAGLLVAGTIALAATWLSSQYKNAPVMLFALLLGMAFHFLHEEGRCVAGIEFASKSVLRLGVALLGARVTFAQIVNLGALPISVVVIGVATTITLGFLAAGPLRQSRTFGVLSGGAVAICGASAALAIATVLPRHKDSERDTILAVVTVTALSTLAMILYPLGATALGMTHVQAGIFLGGTIHDVAQVVGAGYTISPQTGDIATYVKLLRVTLLLPVVFAIAFVTSRQAGSAVRARAPLPWFLVAFAILVVLGSLGLVSKPMVGVANDVSRWCLVTAIAALGMKTSFKALVEVGWRPVVLMVVETAWIFGLVLGAVLIFS